MVAGVMLRMAKRSSSEKGAVARDPSIGSLGCCSDGDAWANVAERAGRERDGSLGIDVPGQGSRVGLGGELCRGRCLGEGVLLGELACGGC
eukprot:688433-Rhodomonas_salina.1